MKHIQRKKLARAIVQALGAGVALSVVVGAAHPTVLRRFAFQGGETISPPEREPIASQSVALMELSYIVLTSVNPDRATEVVGQSEMVYEIVGKPVDLDRIVAAVKEASKARPTPRGKPRT